jgi:hypothetical protein
MKEPDMNKSERVCYLGAMAAAVAIPVASIAKGVDRTRLGTLNCDVSGGIGAIIASKKSVACMFTPAQSGPTEV